MQIEFIITKHQTMKEFRSISLLLLFTGFLSLISCNKEDIENYTGKWEAEPSEITVRTKNSSGDYLFTHDSAAAGLEIFSDNTASGFIGTATFDHAKVKKNSGNPETTGLAFQIECGKIGKIFPDDPLDSKEVEIWLCPVEGDRMDSELRYTEGRAHFPMAGLLFYRAR